ncbi:hypothetical protein SOVF_147210 [Spinacia oleracea]|uniref:Uncharacterized protein n=1 Tax=Spinacia oleracea TaxID=3562 RepID=A0ABM3QMR0_SPIOL|nr:uncharacterized protein LOC110800723 [Spinacia oleracea]KNA10138.1 hypothetical protein SOVF_147210 [Spinacia oleracea]
MGDDGLKVGVRIRKFVIITTKFCYRSVYNHPFVVGLLLLLLFLYRSFPLLFSVLVSTSPVLVCTAVLLGCLLSFGEPNVVPECDEDEKVSHEIVQSKTGRFESSTVVEEDECVGSNSRYTEMKREYVKIIDEEPLLDNTDRLDKSEVDGDDVGFGSMSTDHNSREIRFEKQWIDETKSELENTEIEQNVDLGDQLYRMGIRVGYGEGENLETRFSSVEKVQMEHFEDYISAEGSVDVQMRDNLASSSELQKPSKEVVLLSTEEVQHENSEDYKSAEGSVDFQLRYQLEPSLASWKQFDVLDDRMYTDEDFQEERFEGYDMAEGSSDAQMRDYIESTLRSWKQMGSDHDEDAEFDSGSDGAESSSPDASMADIIPMLDELDPLLDDENLQPSSLSRQSSAASMEKAAISPDSSIHSDDESDRKDDEADDGKTYADDGNEKETQVGKKDPAKSVIMWTEDDQKNLMDLGTSEMERNQRLESLIARRRARKMTGDRNLIDMDGMDLPFPVVPISTRRDNPFNFPQDSYADLGLPPIPGSAPSIMLSRRNPFDLPYDSSEEKPDLTEDSFQQEFTELTHREVLFRRNETFNMGSSSGFDSGRPSRFRPYFVPERTDSDMMSYSSLQRQLSELSESKASSAAETESTSAGEDQEEKKQIEHDSVQEVEPSFETDHASVIVEHGSQSSVDLDLLLSEEKNKNDFVLSELEVELGRANSDMMNYSSLERQLSERSESRASSSAEKESTSVGADQEEKKLIEHDSAQEVEPSSEIDPASALVKHGSLSSEDLDSLSDDEQDKKDFVLSVFEVELGRAKSSSAAASYTSETVESADNRLECREMYPAVEPWLSHSKFSHSDSQSVTELIEVNHSISCSALSTSNALNDEKAEDVDSSLVNWEESQVNNLLKVDIPVKYSLEPSASLETSEHSQATEVDGPKEPVYDFSPLKMNHSLSSSSSDLQRDTSGIDLYHLSRDLFVVEELNVHNQDAENISGDTKQDADGNGLTMSGIGEGSGLDSTDFFSEVTQLPGNSPTLVVTEDEGHLNIDSLDKGLKDRVSYDTVSPHEVEEIFAQKDSAENHLENKLDNMPPSADRHEFAEDSVLAQEKTEVVLADILFPVHSILSSSQAESKDDIQEEMKVSQQFQVPSSSWKSCENEGNETLGFSLDEKHFCPHDSDVHDPCSDSAEQEQYIINRKLEEADQVDKIDEPVNVLMVQELQHKILSDQGQSSGSFSQPEDYETTIPEFKQHIQDTLETRHAYMIEENHEVFEGFEGPLADEHIMNEVNNDVKEMDEALFSELDAIGDFRVSNIEPNSGNSMINLDAAIVSNIPAEAIGEVYASTEMPFDHETLLGDSSSTHLGNSESEKNVTGTNLPETKESNLDSHKGNISTDLLDLEAQSVEDIDAAFMKVSEEVENSVVTESVPAEFTRKVEDVSLETELLLEDTELGGCPSEVLALTADSAFNTRESVPERTQPDLAFLQGQDLDSVWNEIVSEKTILDPEIIEHSSEDVEKVEADNDKSDSFEALQTVTETGVDSVESMPLQIQRDIKELDESPLVEASTAPDLEPRDQTESVGSMEFEPLLVDRAAVEVQESLVLDASDSLVLEPEDEALKTSVLGSITPAVESESQIERNTYEPLLLGKEGKEIQESDLVGISIGSALDPEHQMEKFDSPRSESLQIDEEVRETQELPAYEGRISPASVFDDQREKVGSSKPLQLNRDIHEVQECPVVEEKEVVDSEESEPLQRDRDVEELRDWHVVEGISSIEPEQLQTDTDIKGIPKSPTAQTSIPAPEFAQQILTVDSGDSRPLLIDRNAGGLQEFPAVEAEIAVEVDSQGQLEEVGFVESEPLQIHQHKTNTSAVEFNDQMEINRQMEVVEVQALQDHQLVSQQQPEVDEPNADDSSRTNVDSTTTVTRSSNNKVDDQGHGKTAGEDITQVEEEKSR